MKIYNLNLYNQNINFSAQKSPVIMKKLQKAASNTAQSLINKESCKIELERNILERLLVGDKIKDITKALGVSIYKVNEISAKYNAHKIYIQTRDNMILEKLKKGVPRKKIMEEMGISKRTVQEVAEANNAFVERVRKRDAYIIEKLKAGEQAKDIAKELGVHIATIWRTAKKLGFSLREFKKSIKN
jgi:FixJ family two-component response regulator